MRFVHLDIWTPNCPNPQITIWAKFGAFRCDWGCNLGHDLSHNLGVIWATMNAPIVGSFDLTKGADRHLSRPIHHNPDGIHTHNMDSNGRLKQSQTSED